MHAITVSDSKTLVWSEVPEPTFGSDEVLIDIAATAVNRADLLQVAGSYPPPPGAPPYLGLECSGRIVEVGGEVTRWKRGDHVCALLGGGGYAERVAVKADHCLPIPEGASLVDAAALPEAACTVWSNIVDIARLTSSETLLVHGGGSGVGTFAIQLAAAYGARVAITARASKHARLKELGAKILVDYTTEDFVTAVKEATSGRGADVILDIVGGDYLERNVKSLTSGGRIVVIGLQGSPTGALNLGSLLRRRGTIYATTLRSRTAEDKTRIVGGALNDVWPLISNGRIRPVVHSRLFLPNAQGAHDLVRSNEHFGKVVLVAPSAAEVER